MNRLINFTEVEFSWIYEDPDTSDETPFDNDIITCHYTINEPDRDRGQLFRSVQIDKAWSQTRKVWLNHELSEKQWEKLSEKLASQVL